jgi:hypothetical protein
MIAPTFPLDLRECLPPPVALGRNLLPQFCHYHATQRRPPHAKSMCHRYGRPPAQQATERADGAGSLGGVELELFYCELAFHPFQAPIRVRCSRVN